MLARPDTESMPFPICTSQTPIRTCSHTFIYTLNISMGLLELTIGLSTMNGFISLWLELIIDLPTMNDFIAQWLELTIDLPTMNGFIPQWLELTIDLPTMNGFIAL